jgi:hypothetical protein
LQGAPARAKKDFVDLIKPLIMAVNELKKDLFSYIENIDEKELFHLLKEDFVFYGKVKGAYITDGLYEDQLNELTELAEEDETKNIDSIDEFKIATDRWLVSYFQETLYQQCRYNWADCSGRRNG